MSRRTNVAHRFRFQLAHAVRNIKAKYGEWIEEREAQQYARQMLYDYDWTGELDKWEADVMGDPNQLDRYVLQTLNYDLLNWAARIVRKKRREDSRAHGKLDPRSALRPDEESVEGNAIWLSWPTLALRCRFRLTDREIAEFTGVSISTVRRRLAKEMADAERTYRPT